MSFLSPIQLLVTPRFLLQESYFRLMIKVSPFRNFSFYVGIFLLIWPHFNMAIAQPVDSGYSIQNFTDEHGLPQNSVKSVTVDNMGFVWLGTEEGLVRFDGRNISDFANVQNSANGVVRYNVIPDMFGNKDHFYAVRFDSPTVRIQNAGVKYDSSFNYKSLLKQLSLVDDTHSMMGHTAPGRVGEDLGSDIYNAFLPVVGRGGSYYKVTRHAISFYENWERQWIKENQFAVLNRFFVIDGFLYHLDNDGDIFFLEERIWKRIALTGDTMFQKDKSNRSLKPQLFCNIVNNQVFILMGDRFYYLQPSGANELNTQLLLENFSFEADNIYSAYYEAKSQTLLLGSLTRGLFVCKKKNFATVREELNGAASVIYSQVSLDSQTIFLPNRRIISLKKRSHRGSRLISGAVRQPAVSSSDMRVMLKDRSGKIWVSVNNTVECYSSGQRKLLHINLLKQPVTWLFEQPSGEVIAAVRGHGYYKIFETNRKPVFMGIHRDSADIVVADRIDDENYWLGTNIGLYKFNSRTLQSSRLLGSNTSFIGAIHAGKNREKTVFFSTKDGLQLFDGIEIISLSKDMRSNSKGIAAIVEDSNEHLWLTTNKGLFQVRIEDLYRYAEQIKKGGSPSLFYRYYDKSSGFDSNEFNGGCQPCALRLGSGYVSLSSMNGLVLFEPEKIKPNLPDGHLVIDRVEEGGMSRLISGDTVLLRSNSKNIAFRITTPYHGISENLHFWYALTKVGEDPKEIDWASVEPTEAVIRFSELGSGSYKLSVRKTNGFGLDNFTIKSIEIFVPLNWYEKFWFKSLIVLLLAGFIFLFFHIRMNSLRRRNLHLEDTVSERTKNLQKTLVSLTNSEKELSRQMQLQSRLIASISHDVVTPINYFANAADLAEGIIKGEDNDDARKLVNELGRSARHIYSFVENLVNFSKSQIYGLYTSGRPLQIHHLVQEKAQIFATVLAQRNVRLIINLPEEQEVVSSPQLLGIIVHNILDNSIKHSEQNSAVTVSGEQRIDGYHLIFSNSGKRFTDEIVNWLNVSHSEDDGRLVPQDYKGLGLLIVKETAAILNIEIQVENEEVKRIHLIFN
jgi:signal transduction histidine kinase